MVIDSSLFVPDDCIEQGFTHITNYIDFHLIGCQADIHKTVFRFGEHPTIRMNYYGCCFRSGSGYKILSVTGWFDVL